MNGADRTGLTIIVATDDPDRFRAALTVATAQAAIGGDVCVYCHEASVALLAHTPRPDDASMRLAELGLPDRIGLIAIAQDSGVQLIACQTGLAIAGLALADLAPGVEAGGLVGVLALLADSRLLAF